MVSASFHHFSAVILFGLMLGPLHWNAAAQATGGASTSSTAEMLARADGLRAEKSYRLARELYEKILAPAGGEKLDAETRAHARVFAMDCLWRERTGGEAFQQAGKELGRLAEDLPADSRWRAEAAESLGDLRSETGEWYLEAKRNEALAAWLVALKYWGEADNLAEAKPRYIALNFKIADFLLNRFGGGIIPYPDDPIILRLGILPPPPPRDHPWEGDLPSWCLRNVLRVSQDSTERAHALYQLGMRHVNFPRYQYLQNEQERKKNEGWLKQWDKETEDYLKQAAAIRPKNEWTDQAYFNLAQYCEQNQKFIEAVKVLEELLANFSKSETRFYDNAREMLKRIKDPSAQVLVAEVYAPDSFIRVQLNYRNIDRATLRVYRLAPDALIEAYRQKDQDAALRALTGEKVKEQALEGIVDEKKHIPHDKTVFLEPLKPGLYVVEADIPTVAEQTVGARPSRIQPVPGARRIMPPRPPRPRPQAQRAIIRVSRLAVAGRNVGAQEQTFVADAETGKPEPGARVRAVFRRQENEQIFTETREGMTDASGVARLERPPLDPEKGQWQVYYFAEKGGQFAQAQSWSYWPMRGRLRGAQGIPEQLTIYATTDRPAYRPDEDLQWKAILRVDEEKGYRLPTMATVYVRIQDERGQPVWDDELPLSAYGSINSSFHTDRKMALGMLNLIVLNHKDPIDQKVLGSVPLARLEEYKLPEYKVSVEPPKEQVKFGAALKFDIAAEYYFGGPVAGADVEVVVYRRAFWPSWRPPRPYPWYYEGDENWSRMAWMPWIWPRIEPESVILTKSLKTDAQGKARVETAALSQEELRQARDRGIWGYEYRVEARVVDASRREVRESGSIKTARTAFAAYLTPQRYLYLPGDPVKIDLKTLDPNEKPVQAEGFMTMYKRTWNKERLNAQGRKAPGYDEVKMIVRPAITGKDGTATVEFSPDEPGCYLFRFETKDKFGADVTGETVVFVAREDTQNVGYRSGGVTIITDKDTYARGETAHVLLAVRHPGAAVWFGVEGETVHDLKVVKLDGAVKLVDIPVTADFEPNIFFTAVSIFDYAAFQDSRRVVVPPKQQFLTVTLKAPKATFKPGEKASVDVEVKDVAGKPVKTELSLGVADAAVWAIQGDVSEDIRKAFWSHLRNLQFNVQSSPAQQQTQRWRPKKDNPDEYEMVWPGSMVSDELSATNMPMGAVSGMGGGMMMESRAQMAFGGAMPAPSAAPMMLKAPMATRRLDALDKDRASGAKELPQLEKQGAPLQPAKLRTNFSATALWLPSMMTDDVGRAHAEVTFPDSLTTWKLTAKAADKQTRVGEVRTEVKTTKPVLVRPQGPRFFTQGDAVTLSAIVNNNTSQSLPVEVSLDLTGLKLTAFTAAELAGASRPADASTEPVPSNVAKLRVMVPAQGSRRVDWRAAAESPGTAKIKTTALSSLDSDAVERSFPVYEYGIEKFIASGATLKGPADMIEQTLTLDIPAERRAGSEGLTLWIEPTLARTMVNALDYLAQYPYGCVEQTVSRFVPAVITARVLDRLGIDKPDLKAKLPDMIKAGLDRLRDFQHADGGWGWWKEDPSDLYMTAYVVQGLTQAYNISVPIDREMISRGERYLAENLVKATEQPDLTAFMLYALSTVRDSTAPPEPVKAAYDRLWGQREKLNAYSRALFTLACHYTNQPERAETLARNMFNGLVRDKANGTAHWGRSGVFYRWSDGAVEATAFSLRALLQVQPESDLIPEAMNWLVRNRKGCRWESTKDTAIVIRALADCVAYLKEDKPDWTAEIEVNGQRVATLRAEPGKAFEFDGKVEVPASKLHTGKNTVVIRRRGTGNLYAAAWLTYFTHEQQITASGNEVFAERKYYRTKLEPTLSGKYKTVREEVKPGTRLNSGDRIEVELNLEAKNNYEYLVIEDMKAAGMEPTEVQSGATWGGGLSAHREFRDEKTAFFVTSMPEGKHTLKYELRAEIPGVFAALPTLVHAMYVPEIRANSDGARITIEDKKK